MAWLLALCTNSETNLSSCRAQCLTLKVFNIQDLIFCCIGLLQLLAFPELLAMTLRYELAVGLNKGHKVTKIRMIKTAGVKRTKTMKLRPSRLKGTQTKHTKFVRDLIREVMGHAPYEKRAMELLKVSKDKRALKYLKRRVSGSLFPYIKLVSLPVGVQIDSDGVNFFLCDSCMYFLEINGSRVCS